MIPSEERSRLPVAFLVGIVIVTLLVGGAVLLSRYSTPAGRKTLKSLCRWARPSRPTRRKFIFWNRR